VVANGAGVREEAAPAEADRHREPPPEPVHDRGEAPSPLAGHPDVTVTRASRLVIERVQLVSAGLTTGVTVALGIDGRTVEGSAEGTATTGSLHRSVAGATLRAIEHVVGEGVRFDVEHVEIATTGTDR